MFGVSVVNFALGSYSALQALIGLKKNISLSPSVIVFGMIEDDLRRSLDPCAPKLVCLEVPTVGGLGRDPVHNTAGSSCCFGDPNFDRSFGREKNSEMG